LHYGKIVKIDLQCIFEKPKVLHLRFELLDDNDSL